MKNKNKNTALIIQKYIKNCSIILLLNYLYNNVYRTKGDFKEININL